MQECDVCVYRDYLPDYPPCSNCLREHDVSGRFSLFCKTLDESEIFEEKQTNADRIRAMSDEELAESIHSVMAGYCPVKTSECTGKCIACWLRWLKQEVDG